MELKTVALIDDRIVEDTYLLRRTVQPPALKQSEPVLRPGQAYGTVLHDAAGGWRMYYLRGAYVTEPGGQGKRWQYREHMATSADGLRWETPPLGLVEIDGSRENSCVMGAHYHDHTGMDLTGATGPEGFCVKDAEQEPVPHARSRYTCLYLASPTDRWGGICLAHSDDGLTWTGYPENPLIPGWPDTQNNFFFDERIGRYVLYMRPTVHTGVEANRKMARAESEDLIHWSVPQVVLDTDETDAPAMEALEEGGKPARGRKRQFYGMTVFPHADLYVGLAWMYDVPSGRIWIELAHSYDGAAWLREAQRVPFIDEGNMVITMSNGPITVGDELWLYASVTARTHGGESTDEFLRDLKMMLFSLPRDRWVSYDAGEVEGELLSRPFTWSGGRLFLNAAIHDGGQIKVVLCDELGEPMRGLGVEEIAPLTGPSDGVMLPAVASIEPPHAPAGDPAVIKPVLKMPTRGPIRLRLKMRKARLFGWAYESAD